MPPKPSYLDPLVLARVGRLKVRAQKVIEGFLSGLHRSPYRGTSLEFAQHRPYAVGDEIKNIDWKIYGRSDRFFVKQFEQETNLRLHLLLDGSGSMGYRGAQSGMSKYDYAATLAASLAYLALNQGDSAGLSIFTGSFHKHWPARGSFAQLSTLVEAMEDAVPSGETAWPKSLEELIPSFEKRSYFVIVSDLLGAEEEALRALKRLAFHRHEVAVIHLLDEDEKEFPFHSNVRFDSMENSARLSLDAEEYRDDYLEALARLVDFYRIGFRKAGIRYQLHSTRESPDRVLRLLLG